MRAVVYTEYGKPVVLKLSEVEKPTPKKNEVLIRIHATAVNSGDCRMRRADPAAVRLFFGLFKPRKQILGVSFAGEVESIGDNVSKFKPGDKVFGMTGMSMGAYAEYKCVNENGCIALIPENLNYEQAASVPFGATAALHFLKKAAIQKGQKVLVYGASGSVGSAAVQIAKHYGAIVTAVCSSANTELVKSLGADKIINYDKEDFTAKGEIYDVVFETVGKITLKQCLCVTAPGGILILGSAGFSDMISGIFKNITSKVKVLSGPASEKNEDMLLIKELIEKKEFKPVIDKIYPLEEIVEAHRYTELGHKKGNVVIRI